MKKERIKGGRDDNKETKGDVSLCILVYPCPLHFPIYYTEIHD